MAKELKSTVFKMMEKGSYEESIRKIKEGNRVDKKKSKEKITDISTNKKDDRKKSDKQNRE